MFKKFIAVLAALLTSAAFAAVDANKGTQAELESIKGIGPVISTLIINERKKGDFKDWNDMVVRVKGVGDKNAAKFSTDGLTVNGASFTGAPMAAKADKPSMGDKTASAVGSTAGKAKDKSVQATDTVKGSVEDKKAAHDDKKAAKEEKKAADAKAKGDTEKATKAGKKATDAKADAAEAKKSAAEDKKKAAAASAAAAKK